MFSNKMFRLSPTFQVFYSTKILRGSYRYWGRYQIRSLTTIHEFYKDRANQLGGPISCNLALKGPCYHRNTRALTIAGLERFSHCWFLPHSLLRTLLNFSTVGSAETLNPWHLIKRLVQNLRWHSMCTAGSAGNSSVTLPSPQSTKPRPMRL